MKIEKTKVDVWKEAKRIITILIGSLIIAMNIKTFVRAGGLFPGGFTGLTILIQNIGAQYFNITIPFSIVNIILNAVPAIVAFKTIGKKFLFLQNFYALFFVSVTSIIRTAGRFLHEPLALMLKTGLLSMVASLYFERTETNLSYFPLVILKRFNLNHGSGIKPKCYF